MGLKQHHHRWATSLWVWGSSRGLGLPSRQSFGLRALLKPCLPTRVPLIDARSRLLKLVTGPTHCFAAVSNHTGRDDDLNIEKTKNLSWYTWGNGEFGQLGISSESHQIAPKRIRFESSLQGDDRVVDAACGPRHSLVRTSLGSVASFGCTRNGKVSKILLELNNSFFP